MNEQIINAIKQLIHSIDMQVNSCNLNYDTKSIEMSYEQWSALLREIGMLRGYADNLNQTTND